MTEANLATVVLLLSFACKASQYMCTPTHNHITTCWYAASRMYTVYTECRHCTKFSRRVAQIYDMMPECVTVFGVDQSQNMDARQ